MLVLPQIIDMKWSTSNKDYYISKGYNFTKIRDIFKINASDLKENSSYPVKVICSFCNQEYITQYRYYMRDQQTPCCSNCISKKASLTVKNKYGVDNVFKNEIIKEKILKSRINTMYKKGNAPSSRQQRYLCNLLSGELNYAVDKCWLDIAFPDEMIYIEYDGSGHDISTTMGVSSQQFKTKEIHRKNYLQNKGWKLIRIISKKDYLPSNNEIKNYIKLCKNYLNSNHTWINLDIDNKLLYCSEFKINIEFKNLKKINKNMEI